MKQNKTFDIELFTDGSSRGNPGPGGCAAILKYNDNIKEISKGYRFTTNNRMELMGAILGLEHLKKKNCYIKIFTDSKYFADAINKKWIENWVKKDFRGKKNKDLWLQIINLFKNHTINVIWLKGHSGHLENERCDKLAVMASTKQDLNIDFEYEKSQ